MRMSRPLTNWVEHLDDLNKKHKEIETQRLIKVRVFISLKKFVK